MLVVAVGKRMGHKRAVGRSCALVVFHRIARSEVAVCQQAMDDSSNYDVRELGTARL